MGMFLNPGNAGFAAAVRSQIYVDKTKMIEFTNSVLGTEQRFVCVSRPRRFGKSMAAKMLSAYYSKGCDSLHLFDKYKIAQSEHFRNELNQSNVLHLDIQWFRSVAKDKGILKKTVSYLQSEVVRELKQQYPDIVSEQDVSLPELLLRIHSLTGEQFVVIIDEWDCLFREDKENKELQDEYINFLRGMFKGTLAESSIKFSYMTGILPIKKYGTESALNNFDEYTMVDPVPLEEYIGFTEAEVKRLCDDYQMDFYKTKQWYDGYLLGKDLHVYSPKSVLDAIRKRRYGSHWTQTETYESLKAYINMDFDGLKSTIISMLDGASCQIDTGAFQNDMTSFKSRDDVLTLLVHLGYLAYHGDKVFIPNAEVGDEFYRAVKHTDWEEITRILMRSEELLDATFQMKAEEVAKIIDEVHGDSSVSHLKYNDENSLSFVIANAYFCARKDYTLIRELPAGKGFADMVFLPKRSSDKPALLIELKWDKAAEGAIAQIKSKQYVKALENYGGDILVVGINYSRKTRKHECVIEMHKKS